MSTDLKLDEPGTLPTPGLIGRLFRLGMGVFCLYAIYELTRNFVPLASGSANTIASLVLFIGFGTWIFSYVINIGFLVSLGRMPMYALLAAYGAAAICGQLWTGSVWSPPLGLTIFVTMFYFYAHLGLSFLLAAIFATPGCEMRAIGHVTERFTGRPAKEHYCPVGPIQPLDTWEAKQFWHRRKSGI